MLALRPKRGRHAKGIHPDQADPDAPRLSTRVTASSSRVLTLTVIDQGASSLSNFALAGIVAHYSHAGNLGVYAIVISTYIVAQGIVRSATSDCMLTRSETDDDVMLPYEQGGYLSAIIGSTVAGAIIALIALALPHTFLAPMLVLGISFPFMALQDFSRYIGISRHDPAYAVRLDVAWLVLFIAAFVVCKDTHHIQLGWLMAAWTGTGSLVGLWTLRQHLARKDIKHLLRFWRDSEGAVGWRFAGQFALSSSWSYVIFYLLAFVLSVGALGIFKLAQLAMGPLSVASVGLQSAMISMAAKKFPVHPMRTLRFIFMVASGTAVVTAAWMFAVYFAPVHAMTKALGPTWPQARHVVIYMGLCFVIASWTGAGAAGLRALRAAKENLWLAVVLIPFLIVPPMVGAEMNGLTGAAFGAVVSNIFNCIFTWVVLVWATRRLKNQTEGRTDAGEPPPPPLPIPTAEPQLATGTSSNPT
jgi:hypothetical protein